MHTDMYINFEENLIDKLKLNKEFLTKKLFSNLELINDENKNYMMKCIYCNNSNVIMSSKYLLQRCNKCRKEYIPNCI